MGPLIILSSWGVVIMTREDRGKPPGVDELVTDVLRSKHWLAEVPKEIAPPKRKKRANDDLVHDSATHR